MMKIKNLRTWILALLPIIITTILFPGFPDEVLVNPVDPPKSKYYLLLIAGMFIVLQTAYVISEFSRKRKVTDADNERTIMIREQKDKFSNLFWFFFLLLMNIMWFFNLYDIYHGRSVLSYENTMKITVAGMGIMLVIMGNLLPKTHGMNDPIKTKWNSANDVTWLKVNRFTGKLMFVSGLIAIIAALVFGGVIATMIMMALLFVIASVSAIYSEKTYQKYETPND